MSTAEQKPTTPSPVRSGWPSMSTSTVGIWLPPRQGRIHVEFARLRVRIVDPAYVQSADLGDIDLARRTDDGVLDQMAAVRHGRRRADRELRMAVDEQTAVWLRRHIALQ